MKTYGERLVSEFSFRGYRVDRAADDTVQGQVVTMACGELPDAELLVRVHLSSMNYKDALSATGHPGISPHLPHVPGIDAVGTVVESSSPRFQPGDEVIVQGQGFGSTDWGAWSEYCRVPADRALAVPRGLSHRELMIHGTAGFTAAQCVKTLIDHKIQPSSGPIVISGATGGVGILAIAILAKLGYQVTAVTGKKDRTDWLKQLGASDVIDRSALEDSSQRPMLSRRWAGGVDTVGGLPLSTMLRQLKEHGCVAACGLAASDKLEMTVYPFILRAVSLIGIDSANCTLAFRQSIWNQLAGPWRLDNLESVTSDIRLDQINDRVTAMLAGETSGRTIIQVGEIV